MNRPLRIMIVDDDPTVLMNLAAYLEDEGFVVLPAIAAEVALEILGATPPPDLAVVDIRMPGMNGEELILAARRRVPALRFLIHTGSSDYTPPAELKSIGVTEADVLRKPLTDLAALREAIERLVKGRSEHRES